MLSKLLIPVDGSQTHTHKFVVESSTGTGEFYIFCRVTFSLCLVNAVDIRNIAY